MEGLRFMTAVNEEVTTSSSARLEEMDVEAPSPDAAGVLAPNRPPLARKRLFEVGVPKPQPAVEQGKPLEDSRVFTEEPPLKETKRADPRVLQMMLLDIALEEGQGPVNGSPGRPPLILLYGVTAEGDSACALVQDAFPYLWFPAPAVEEGDQWRDLAPGEGCVEAGGEGIPALRHLQDHINWRCAVSSRRGTPVSSAPQVVRRMSIHLRTPLMYYRPDGASAFLKVELWRDQDLESVARELSATADNDELRAWGATWRQQGVGAHEENIKLARRFLCDHGLSGGGWLEVWGAEVAGGEGRRRSSCSREVEGSCGGLRALTISPLQGHLSSSLRSVGYLPKAMKARATSTDAAPSPSAPASTLPISPASGVSWLHIPRLRVVVLSAIAGDPELPSTSGRSGKLPPALTPDPESQPLLLITMLLCESPTPGTPARPSRIFILSHGPKGAALRGHLASAAVGSRGAHAGGDGSGGGGGAAGEARRDGEGVCPCTCRAFGSEAEMLRGWEGLVGELDPDVMAVFQARDSIRYILERARVLKVGRTGSLELGRRRGSPAHIKSVVSYGKQWVRSQARMAATSNQEVFQARLEGRVFIDVLRPVTMAHTLATFSLHECCQVFLGETHEVLSPEAVRLLWSGAEGGPQRLAW